MSNPKGPVRLRQIALVAEDLERAKHLLTYILDTEVIYEDPLVAQWGLKNFLVPLNGDLLEVVSPIFPRPSTSAGRFLLKHSISSGGYMLIMQCPSASSRRSYIETQNLGRVIFSYDHGQVECVQYHPKTVPGGVITECDSHGGEGAEGGLERRIARWHACGGEWESYRGRMERSKGVRFKGVVCRLGERKSDMEQAARRWEEVFGVERKGNKVEFLGGVELEFLAGEKGKREGIESIRLDVDGKDRLDRIIERAGKEGLKRVGESSIEMLGSVWEFSPREQNETSSRL